MSWLAHLDLRSSAIATASTTAPEPRHNAQQARDSSSRFNHAHLAITPTIFVGGGVARPQATPLSDLDRRVEPGDEARGGVTREAWHWVTDSLTHSMSNL